SRQLPAAVLSSQESCHKPRQIDDGRSTSNVVGEIIAIAGIHEDARGAAYQAEAKGPLLLRCIVVEERRQVGIDKCGCGALLLTIHLLLKRRDDVHWSSLPSAVLGDQ